MQERRYMARQEGNEFAGIRHLDSLHTDDNDLYAIIKVNGQDQIVQKQVRFDSLHRAVITWVPFNPSDSNGFCQAPSSRYEKVINDNWHGDPRSAAGAESWKYGGNPEERIRY